ncbi:uncharacterized protein LOC143849344 isoform X2 [Tasmannia lanceolata]|uniref:uncharacterized protein LOC143849344 isoform X2 n=1 Tax=Tasmannia lanceolata TaxID=3420 RepID=UPI00406321AB
MTISGGEASIVAELVDAEENTTQKMQTLRAPLVITVNKSAAYALSKCSSFFDFSCHIQYICLSWIVLFGLFLATFPTVIVLIWLLHQKGFFDPLYDWWEDRVEAAKEIIKVDLKHEKEIRQHHGRHHHKENDFYLQSNERWQYQYDTQNSKKSTRHAHRELREYSQPELATKHDHHKHHHHHHRSQKERQA